MKKNSVEMQSSYDFSPSKRIEPPYKQRLASNPERRITVHPSTPILFHILDALFFLRLER